MPTVVGSPTLRVALIGVKAFFLIFGAKARRRDSID
jgi:hypothetical protein